jgi:hypothetical protein
VLPLLVAFYTIFQKRRATVWLFHNLDLKVNCLFGMQAANIELKVEGTGEALQDGRAVGHYNVKDMTVFVLTFVGLEPEASPPNANSPTDWAKFG